MTQGRKWGRTERRKRRKDKEHQSVAMAPVKDSSLLYYLSLHWGLQSALGPLGASVSKNVSECLTFIWSLGLAEAKPTMHFGPTSSKLCSFECDYQCQTDPLCMLSLHNNNTSPKLRKDSFLYESAVRHTAVILLLTYVTRPYVM